MTTTFPSLPGLGNEIKRKVAFSSARYRAMSGQRTVTPLQTVPIWAWTLPFNFLRAASWQTSPAFSEFETLLGFFNARSADGLVFRYNDPDDNTATLAGFGAGDGVTTQFQLYRPFGGFAEPVYDPTVTHLYVNGVEKFSPGDWSLGGFGVITFTAPPANGLLLTWTGTFNWLCRFDQDELDMARIVRGLYAPGSGLAFSNEVNP